MRADIYSVAYSLPNTTELIRTGNDDGYVMTNGGLSAAPFVLRGEMLI